MARRTLIQQSGLPAARPSTENAKIVDGTAPVAIPSMKMGKIVDGMPQTATLSTKMGKNVDGMHQTATLSTKTGPIVDGTSALRWYAARVHHGVELKVRDRLAAEGVEHFIPTERRQKTRGKGVAECPRINALVFLRTTRKEALEMANGGLLPVRYIVDCATRTLLVVPDKEMEDFRRVLDLSLEEGGLMDAPLAVGERVRVTKGALKGVEGHVLEFQGKTYVVVSLLDSIFAKAKVPRAWLEKA